jgi:hypothetical protein
VQRWNLPSEWVISREPAHPALVSEADFIAAQGIHAAHGPSPRTDLAGPEKRRYLWNLERGLSERGPDVFPFDELGRLTLVAQHDDRTVITDDKAGVFAGVTGDVLTAGPDVHLALNARVDVCLDGRGGLSPVV